MRDEEEWKRDIAREYSIYAIPSWIPGVWPLLPDNYFTAFRFYIAVILLFSTILTLGSEIIQNCGDARQTTDQFVFCAVTLNSITKTILLRIFRKEVSNNYKEAEQDWSITEDKDFLEIMESYKKLSRKVYFFEAAVHYLLFLMYMIAPKLSEEEQMLPLSTPCLSKNISDIGYQSVYFLQTLQTFYVFNGNVGTDFFFFAIVMHICGQVEVLRIKLSRIAKQEFIYERENDKNFEESMSSFRQRIVDEKNCSYRMNTLIERHMKLINLANDVQNILSITLLVQLSNSIVIMCTLGLQSLLFLQAGDIVSAGRTISGYLIVALGLFLYCYMGDNLQYQFEKVSEAAYNCHWYNLPPRISKTIINIQMRASHFINLRAGKMCDMNFEMFKTSMKTAMSFFSISTVFMIGTEVYFSIVFNCGELRQAADHFLFWTVTVIATIKTILLRMYRNKLLKNCNSARNDWLKEDDPESLKVMTNHAKVSRIVFIFQAVFSYFTLVMYIISPMASTIEGEQGLPLQTVCVFRNMSILEYQGVYFLQAVQQLYIVNGNIGTDYFFFAMIMHVCGQIQIVSLKFNKFTSRGTKYEEEEDNLIVEYRIKDEAYDENYNVECFRRIRILINRHCELLDLADDLKKSLTYILLVQFTMDIIMMCLTGLLTLIYLQQGDTVTAGRTICGFSIVVMSLFIYCYIGDNLQYQFEKVSEAAYKCHWYNLPPKISRNIVHIQIRGRCLMKITAGKFCSINLEMFKTAMKTAMSFFSVMRILLDKGDALEL